MPAARVGTRSATSPAFSLDLCGRTQVTSFSLAIDLPLVGDWNGDGFDEIGAYRPSSQRFYFDMDGNLQYGAPDFGYTWGAANVLPFARRG